MGPTGKFRGLENLSFTQDVKSAYRQSLILGGAVKSNL